MVENSLNTPSKSQNQIARVDKSGEAKWKRHIHADDENDGKPTREIFGDPNDEGNIMPGKRSRKPKVQFHLEVHNNLDQQSAFHAAFNLGSKLMKARLHKSNLPPSPENWSQLQYHPHRQSFESAAHLGHTTLEKQRTFQSIPESQVKVMPIPVKWVFTYKTDDDGYLIKYKARMVIRGGLQIPTEKDTYAATQFDVTNAFPHADLDDDDDVVIHYPGGFKIPGHKLKVLKALYGFSISPRLWYNHLATTLEKLDRKPVPESGCVFCNEKLIICFYVDDISVFYHIRNSDFFEKFKRALLDVYTVKDMGELKWFLGIRILRDRSQRKLWLVQDSYIAKLATNFDRVDSEGKLRLKAPDTPMAIEETKAWDGQATSHQIYKFQRRVGSLTYAATLSRPDIACLIFVHG